MIITRPSHCELIQDPRLLIVLPAPGTALGQSKIILVKKLDILVILPASSVYPASGCGVLKVTCRCSMLPKTIWNPQGSRAEVEMMSLSSLPSFSPQTCSPSLLCQNLKRLGRDCATPRGGGGYLLLMAWGAHLCSPSLEAKSACSCPGLPTGHEGVSSSALEVYSLKCHVFLKNMGSSIILVFCWCCYFAYFHEQGFTSIGYWVIFLKSVLLK